MYISYYVCHCLCGFVYTFTSLRGFFSSPFIKCNMYTNGEQFYAINDNDKQNINEIFDYKWIIKKQLCVCMCVRLCLYHMCFYTLYICTQMWLNWIQFAVLLHAMKTKCVSMYRRHVVIVCIEHSNRICAISRHTNTRSDVYPAEISLEIHNTNETNLSSTVFSQFFFLLLLLIVRLFHAVVLLMQ